MGKVIIRIKLTNQADLVLQERKLMKRRGDFNVVDIDEDVPNLLGQVPLEYLDFVVDPQGQKLIPNPEHGEKQMTEEY
jgi:hypothetical protein